MSEDTVHQDLYSNEGKWYFKNEGKMNMLQHKKTSPVYLPAGPTTRQLTAQEVTDAPAEHWPMQPYLSQ